MRRLAVVLLFVALLAAALTAQPRNTGTPGLARDHAHTFQAGTSSVAGGAQTAQDERLTFRSERLSSSFATVRATALPYDQPTPPPTPTPFTTAESANRAAGVPDYLIAEWAKVAWCEEGGTAGYQANGPWFRSGKDYPDSLGISAANWYSLGGGSDVSAPAQVAVAERIQSAPPDQGAVPGVSRAGCAPW